MASEIDLADFDYALPPERIAQQPPAERDAARLLVLERATGARHHSHVRALPEWLARGDVLVRNATQVLPARLRGHKDSGGHAEALLLGGAGPARHYRALLRVRGRLRPGLKLRFAAPAGELDAELVEVSGRGEGVLVFAGEGDPYALGETPLPPYIRRKAPEVQDAARYQTLFARVPGAVAAPTAGLHFSSRLLDALVTAGIESTEVVLHVGPGSFRPLLEDDLHRDRLHAEPFALPAESAERVDAARARGGRSVAVGTTSARVLESCVGADGRLTPREGSTELFLRPGSRFRAVDCLLTNFHLPRSSLLLLVAAFAGRELVLESYAEAVREGYRFYSYGDAMLIL